MQRLTIQCNSCHVITRAEITHPSTHVGGLQYCPSCGAHSTAMLDPDTDTWEALSTAYHIPIPLLKQIYNMWDYIKYPSFTDYLCAEGFYTPIQETEQHANT
jgi:hypothetical protein